MEDRARGIGHDDAEEDEAEDAGCRDIGEEVRKQSSESAQLAGLEHEHDAAQ